MVLVLGLVLGSDLGVVLGVWEEEDWERFAFAGVYCWTGLWV